MKIWPDIPRITLDYPVKERGCAYQSILSVVPKGRVGHGCLQSPASRGARGRARHTERPGEGISSGTKFQSRAIFPKMRQMKLHI